jgi:hypothetical protein
MPTKTTIVVSLQVPAFHNWPGAPDADISFLRDRHRHIFHIKARKVVSHDDRDIEIIRFKTQILSALSSWYSTTGTSTLHGHLELGSTSCEQLGQRLVDSFSLESCEVLEDGENGAYIERTEA